MGNILQELEEASLEVLGKFFAKDPEAFKIHVEQEISIMEAELNKRVEELKFDFATSRDALYEAANKIHDAFTKTNLPEETPMEETPPMPEDAVEVPANDAAPETPEVIEPAEDTAPGEEISTEDNPVETLEVTEPQE